MLTIIKKEIYHFFSTPIAYVFLILFFVISLGLYFFNGSNIFVINQINIRSYFSLFPLLFIFFLPAFTMHQWSEEKKQGTFEILSTLPIPSYKIVLGKFLASWLFLLFPLTLTLALPLTLSFLGDIDSGQVMSNYFGTSLLGATYIAFGLWISSLTKDQIVAFLISAAGLFLFNLLSLPIITSYIPENFIPIMQNLSFQYHFESLTRGVIDSRDVIFFVLATGIFLYLNYLVIHFKISVYKNILPFVLCLCILATSVFFLQNLKLRFDLTDEKEFTLSEATKSILNQFKDKLTIKLYYSKKLPPQLLPIQQRIEDLLEEMKANSKQDVHIKFEDPDSTPEKESETRVLGMLPAELNIKEKDKIEVRKVYMGMALYYQDKKSVIPFLANTTDLEYVLALNLLKIVNSQKPKVGILIDDDAADKYKFIGKIVEYFAIAFYLDPAKNDWTKNDLDSLLIINPQNFTLDHTTQMDELLENGTNLMIFAGKTDVNENLIPQKITTGLEEWLENKGIEISQNVLIDNKQNAKAIFQEGYLQLVVDYPLWVKALKKNLNSQNPVTSRLEEILFPWTNAIFGKQQEKTPWQTQVLVQSSAFSQLQDTDVPNYQRRYLADLVKSKSLATYPLAILLQHENQKDYGKVFLASNHHMLKDEFFKQSQSNAVFVQNVLEYFSWGDTLIQIRSRGKTNRIIETELTEWQKDFIKWMHIAGLPVIAILLGVIYLYYKKQQRKKFIKSMNKYSEN